MYTDDLTLTFTSGLNRKLKTLSSHISWTTCHKVVTFVLYCSLQNLRHFMINHNLTLTFTSGPNRKLITLTTHIPWTTRHKVVMFVLFYSLQHFTNLIKNDDPHFDLYFRYKTRSDFVKLYTLWWSLLITSIHFEQDYTI